MRLFNIIPNNVLTDRNLSDKAKLLYGVIAGLSNKIGYCFASNKHFTQYFDVSESRISSMIAELRKAGYITVDNDKRTNRRKIFVLDAFLSNEEPILPDETAILSDKKGIAPDKKGSSAETLFDTTLEVHKNKPINTVSSKINTVDPSIKTTCDKYFLDQFKNHTQTDYQYQTKDAVQLNRWIKQSKADDPYQVFRTLVDNAFDLFNTGKYPFQTVAPTIAMIISKCNELIKTKPSTQPIRDGNSTSRWNDA